MNEKLTEEYWRVDWDTAKLLKEAAFNCEVTAHFDPTIIGNEYQCGSHLGDWNKWDCYSAPLISVALEWCKELGYADGCFDYMYVITYKGKTLKSVDMSTPEYPEQDRQQLFYFIQACCKHRIEQLKQM